MKYQGKVVKQVQGAGSKSEHEAVCLESAQGVFKIRLTGGNPFHDPALDALVGKSIIADGEVDKVSNQLFISKWTEASS